MFKNNKYKNKKLLKNRKEIILFSISFLYLVILGILLTYNYNFYDNFNLLFGSDSSRVISDLTSIGANHYRAGVHPLFIILIQPIAFFLNGVFINKALSIVVLSAFISSITVVFLYKSIKLINKNEFISFLLALIYLFSFSNLIFTAGIETYNFSALGLVLLWYYYLKKRKDTYNKESYIILIFLGVLAGAFTITNFIIYIIILFLLVLEKRIKIKKAIIILLLTITSIVTLNFAQRLIWHSTPLLVEKKSTSEEKAYINKQIKLKNISNILKADYIDSLISSNIDLNINYGDSYYGENFEFKHGKNNMLILLLIIAFYLELIYFTIKKSKNKILNIGIIIALAFNSGMHLFYGNEAPFLYSLHFLYLIILLFGINYNKENNRKKEKFISLFLLLFLIIQIIVNNISFIKIIKYCHRVLDGNYFIKHLGLSLTIFLEVIGVVSVFIIFCIFIYLIKKIKNYKGIEQKIVSIIYMVLLAAMTISIFIGIESIIINDILSSNRFHLNANKQIKKVNKEEYLSKKFKNYFKNEIKELTTYRAEIEELKNSYDTEIIKIDEHIDYYYFGLGNRKKILYIPGKLIDIETKEVLYSFKEKESMIVPNIYSVIIRTEDNKYIKIYEDQEGVHYNISGNDKIIEGTDIKVELYEFSNQQYQNIKKVLYSEILFNIKNSTIYPNIIVYEKPWYRDAAIVCMALKQTNNIDLINDWVKNIDNIYDEQNGLKESDNLGELLYILSTQEEKNEDLIDRIEEEAERIAEENEKGYYIEGKTDFGDMHLYQNLWYKLGIEAIGREFKFDIDNIEEDSYTKLAWWSDYNLDYQKIDGESKLYPYLTLATTHRMKSGKILLRDKLYPLSWETAASAANYNNYQGLLPLYSGTKTATPHSWTAAELLLLLMDETGEFELK